MPITDHAAGSTTTRREHLKNNLRENEQDWDFKQTLTFILYTWSYSTRIIFTYNTLLHVSFTGSYILNINTGMYGILVHVLYFAKLDFCSTQLHKYSQPH
jgi:hypothetical protein